MTKVPRKKKDKRMTVGALLAKGCLNCGEEGPHYYPPGFGTPGGWICAKKDADEDNA